MPRSLLISLLVASAIACLAFVSGCDGSSSGPADIPEFLSEKTADDFPGISYPAHTEPLTPPSAPVWLIGIDGATWDLIRPLSERGLLPNFDKLHRESAHGVLLSEEPTISPALWATIATGMPRFQHGIVNFLVKLPGSYQTVESGPLDRLSPAVWELTGSAGGTSAVLGWFGSFPAEAISGVYVSKGFDPQNPLPNQVHPASFAEHLAREQPAVPLPGEQQQIARNESFRRSLAGDAIQLESLEIVSAELKPDLLMAYFSGIDVVQHVAWGPMDPQTRQFPDDPIDSSMAGVIPAYYQFMDRALGRILELVPDDATLMVVSDHGAGPMQVEEAFHLQLEVLLQELGLMRESGGEAFAIGELYRHDKRIWLNLAGFEENGVVQAAAMEDAMDALYDRLANLRTDTGQPLFASIVDHTQRPGWRPGRAIFTVRFSSEALLTEYVVDGDRQVDFSPVRLRHADVSGSHRLEGVVMLRGPGIEPGPLKSTANLYQIAPTILYRLGLPQDARMLGFAPADGGVIDAALWPDVPVLAIAEYPDTDRSQKVRQGTATGEDVDPALEENLEKLRSLGYIQ